MRFKLNKIISVSFLACLLMGGFVFNACTPNEPEAATVKLNAFGPSPALRGGELKFIGTNMDKVTAVDIPGTAEITTFVSKTSAEVTVTIPQDATPGLVTLKSPLGDIVTKTPLSFLEPISITTFSPATVKAGDKLTINGDYLNLIAHVIFANGVVVDSADFVSQTRQKLEVLVPNAAQTGKVSISNGSEIPVLVYTATELAVTLPNLSTLTPNPVKPGADLQITGTDFQLVKSIIFTDGLVVNDFTVNTAKTGITVTVPAMAKEGSVKLMAFSGVIIKSTDSLNLVAPVITGIAPNPAKNGTSITLTGTDLDLAIGATFEGNITATIVNKTATSLELSVPLTAIDGKVVLSTNSGKTAESSAISFIKPTISSITPLALMAGGDITINGTDLDLVTKVDFIGGLSVNVTPTSATSLTVTVPSACAGTDVITLETANGTKVVSTDQLAIEAANKPVITAINASVKPGALLTITGTKLNLVESIYFQDNVKAILYGVRSETSIEVYVPETAKKGAVTLTMNAYDGSVIVSPTFTISGTDPVVDASYVFFNFDGKNSWWGDKGVVENDAALSLDGSNYFRINDDMNPWWTGLFWRNSKNDLKTDGVTTAEWAVKLDVNVLTAVTGDMKLRFNGGDGDFWAPIHGFEAKGGWYTVTVPLTDFVTANGAHIPNFDNMNADFGLAYAGPGEHVNMCIDNVRFEKISGLGSPIRLY